MKPRISAVVARRNEEDPIEDCLRSVSWCDEVLVNPSPEQLTGDWILRLDANELCTRELQAAFERTECDSVAGFQVRRRVSYLGRRLLHGEWGAEWELRIVRRGNEPPSTVRRLNADILYRPYPSFSHHLRAIQRSSDLEVLRRAAPGRPPSLARLVLRPVMRFLDCFLWRMGYRDGLPGFSMAAAAAFAVFTENAKLWERSLTRS